MTAWIHASPYLTRFPAALDPSPYPHTLRYRTESADPDVGEPVLPNWWPGSTAPLVYVTFGTVTASLDGVSDDLYRAAITSLSDLDARVLVTTGRGHRPALGPLPPRVHVEEWVDQADVMREASVVVCHGGSGTVLGALAFDVPVVVVAMFADQPVNGRRLVDAGAGVLLARPVGSATQLGGINDDTIGSLRKAVHAVLGQADFRDAARAIATDLSAAPDVAVCLSQAIQG